MQICIRPHCAIRNHNHDSTFAEFLELDEYYCNIASSFKYDKNIENYKILSDNLSKFDQLTCMHIINDMLICVENETNPESRKLKILYLFAMCRTIHFIVFMKTVNSKLKEAIYGAYNRSLKDGKNDKLFISEMEKVVPV
jgi:hypothetical protein